MEVEEVQVDIEMVVHRQPPPVEVEVLEVVTEDVPPVQVVLLVEEVVLIPVEDQVVMEV